MATDTDTAPAERERAANGATRPAEARMPSRGRRILIACAAVVAACVAAAALAVVVLRGDDDATEPANRAALANQAEQYVEWQKSRAASASDANRAALQHQADQYLEWLESRAE